METEWITCAEAPEILSNAGTQMTELSGSRGQLVICTTETWYSISKLLLNVKDTFVYFINYVTQLVVCAKAPNRMLSKPNDGTFWPYQKIEFPYVQYVQYVQLKIIKFCHCNTFQKGTQLRKSSTMSLTYAWKCSKKVIIFNEEDS